MKNKEIGNSRKVGSASGDTSGREAGNAVKINRIWEWAKWGVAAVCLFLIIGAIYVNNRVQSFEESLGILNGGATQFLVAYGFVLDDKLYFPIGFDERKTFGLVDENAVGLTEENTYEITQSDLGARMGVIKESADPALTGSAVYHFAAYPDSEQICIVVQGRDYAFYTFAWIPSVQREGVSSKALLAAYGIKAGAVTKIRVTTGEDSDVTTIIDPEQIAHVIDILSGKKDIGNAAHEQRFADLWYETYENRDVYYDGTSMRYPNDPQVYDTANQLWNSNQRQMYIETAQGFSVYFLYNPAIKSINTHSCYYLLSDQEASALSWLLGV